MAYNNAAPTIWAKELMVQREQESAFANIVYKKYEGDIKNAGDRVKIVGLGRPTIGTYTKGSTVAAEYLSDNSQELLIDQFRYFDFVIDAVDEAQAQQDILMTQIQEARRALVDASEDFLAGFYTECGSSVTNSAATSNTILSSISEAMQKLYENNVPTNEEICLVVSPAIHQKLVLAKVLYGMPNETTLEAGFVGRVLGCKVYMTNAVKTSNDYHKCMALTKKALAFAEQIPADKVLIDKNPETTFGTLVKALHIYGAKMIRPGDACLLDLKPGNETSTL